MYRKSVQEAKVQPKKLMENPRSVIANKEDFQKKLFASGLVIKKRKVDTELTDEEKRSTVTSPQHKKSALALLSAYADSDSD